MSNKHTPGPWNVCKGTNGFTETWQVEYKTPMRHKTIADCGAVTLKNFQGSTEHYTGESANNEAEANAKLIAAVPQLLELVELLADTEGAYLGGDHTRKLCNEVLALIK